MSSKNETKTPLSKSLEVNLAELGKRLDFARNFDLVKREMVVGGKPAALLFVNGLISSEQLSLVLQEFPEIGSGELKIDTFQKIFYRYIASGQVTQVGTVEEVINSFLSGPVALLIEKEPQAIIIDVRQYPGRAPDEPDLEKVTRGSRDGFAETLILNTALLRRRIRDPRLRLEHLSVGARSRTDVAIAYIEDIAKPDIVDSVREKINRINIDGLPMAEKSVEELITPGTYWNPFPRVRYTERPDVAAAHLLDGHVIIMVDTSPSAMILPATMFHHLQHAEEFRQNPSVGVYIRWVRYIGVVISLILTPLWLLVALEPQLLPASLKFIGPKNAGAVPLFLQFFMAEVAVDMIRVATIHTPSPIATSTGIIGAILLGQLAAQVGLFVPEVVLYVAAAAIGTFLTPSFELAQANRLARLFILLLTGFFRLPGFILGVVATFVLLVTTRSFGVPYLWPLLPFNFRALGHVLVRPPVAVQHSRPAILQPLDPDRQPGMAPAKKPVFPKRRT